MSPLQAVGQALQGLLQHLLLLLLLLQQQEVPPQELLLLTLPRGDPSLLQLLLAHLQMPSPCSLLLQQQQWQLVRLSLALLPQLALPPLAG